LSSTITVLVVAVKSRDHKADAQLRLQAPLAFLQS
jgi:hypothetical protein